MGYTELDLAQLERRVLAGERCVARQKDVLGHHIAAALPTESALQLLAEFEATLAELRNARNQVRTEITAATTQRLMESFWSLPAERRRALTAEQAS